MTSPSNKRLGSAPVVTPRHPIYKGGRDTPGPYPMGWVSGEDKRTGLMSEEYRLINHPVDSRRSALTVLVLFLDAVNEISGHNNVIERTTAAQVCAACPVVSTRRASPRIPAIRKRLLTILIFRGSGQCEFRRHEIDSERF